MGVCGAEKNAPLESVTADYVLSRMAFSHAWPFALGWAGVVSWRRKVRLPASAFLYQNAIALGCQEPSSDFFEPARNSAGRDAG